MNNQAAGETATLLRPLFFRERSMKTKSPTDRSLQGKNQKINGKNEG